MSIVVMPGMGKQVNCASKNSIFTVILKEGEPKTNSRVPLKLTHKTAEAQRPNLSATEKTTNYTHLQNSLPCENTQVVRREVTKYAHTSIKI